MRSCGDMRPRPLHKLVSVAAAAASEVRPANALSFRLFTGWWRDHIDARTDRGGRSTDCPEPTRRVTGSSLGSVRASSRSVVAVKKEAVARMHEPVTNAKDSAPG